MYVFRNLTDQFDENLVIRTWWKELFDDWSLQIRFSDCNVRWVICCGIRSFSFSMKPNNRRTEWFPFMRMNSSSRLNIGDHGNINFGIIAATKSFCFSLFAKPFQAFFEISHPTELELGLQTLEVVVTAVQFQTH